MSIVDSRFVPKEMKGQLFNRLQEREVSFELGAVTEAERCLELLQCV